jgi:hypothetical protein
MFWSSLIELGLFFLGFVLFCAVPELMAFIWLHTLHIPRAFIGFCILKRLPRSHDIVDMLQIPDDHYSIPQLTLLLKESMSRIFITYSEKCKKLLLAYGILTSIAIFFDLVEFII